MYIKPEDREIGKENFEAAISAEIAKDKDGKDLKDSKGNYYFNRREFLAGTVAAGVVSGGGLGAMYFGYGKNVPDPVRIGFIGTGDEGGVLIGAHNPEYMNCVAIADIRPYNIHRAFHGDWSSDNAYANRPGLIKKYGYKSEEEAKQKIKVYATNYEELLDDPNVEAVVIALPLHLHAEAAIKAMRKGKHVLTEKLMAQTVGQCKEMGRVSNETNLMLATGHQRHYSILYDNAKHTIRNGFLGDIHHIRAQWHRYKDTWSPDIPAGKGLEKLKKESDKLADQVKNIDANTSPADALKLKAKYQQALMKLKDETLDAAKYGYLEKEIIDELTKKTYTYTPIEELVRWRLWERTGGGLMAELGSHQLDASTIFCTEAAKSDKPGFKAHPLSVTALGWRHLYGFERQAEDHVYCMYEFPGPKYHEDPNNKIVVTYSSINGSPFGDYGEVVMGTKATLVLEKEAEAMLFQNENKATKVAITAAGGALDTTASGGAAPSAGVGKAALEAGPISRGYTEELEHWAWCIRNQGKDKIADLVKNDPVRVPRCHPKVAMADAIIALTTNMCMRPDKDGKIATPQIKFDEKWFDIEDDATPEGHKIDVNKSQYNPSSTSKTTV